jgi:hypothetical protein
LIIKDFFSTQDSHKKLKINLLCFKKTYLAACFVALAYVAVGQSPLDDTLRLEFQFEATMPALQGAEADPIGQVYVYNALGTIEKYNPSGQRLASFSTREYGPIRYLDASNPLKLLVWYGDFRTVLLLDRNLTQLGGPLRLLDVGLPDVRTVGMAADGNLWVYDEVAFLLKKINPEGQQLLESQVLSTETTTGLRFTCIRDDGRYVLAADSNAGLFLFDVYGQFLRKIDQRGIDRFAIVTDFFVWMEANQALRAHAFQDLAITDLTNPLPTALRRPEVRWAVSSTRVLAQMGDTLRVYR